MTPPAVATAVSVKTVRSRARRAPRQSALAVQVSRVTAPPAEKADASAEFAGYVLSNLDGPVLRYSDRLVLLANAERRGIGRFEANLIIAAVLHQHGMGQEYEIPPVPGAGWREWAWPVVTFVGLQGAIVMGAWWVLG
jgi:hypothetical protein